jgi:glycosyltransferase involved in cell wall biosynthesis
MSIRTAVVHEWLENTGGSEQVFVRLTRLFPGADRYCLWVDRSYRANGGVHESWLAHSPLRGRKALSLPLMPVAWRSLSRRSYNLVISSSHCMAHTVRFPAGSADTIYLSYIHTPMRYVWSPELDSRGSGFWLSPGKVVFRRLDRWLGAHVDGLAANSAEVRSRIRAYWGKDATVIAPPVDVDFFAQGSPEKAPFREYVLGAGRWVPYKNFPFVVRVGQRLGIPTVLAGSGPEEPRLRLLAARSPTPVRLEVSPSRGRLRALYAGATALVFPGHEDFGMVPVEAMSAGTPVVGLARGGLLETVEPGSGGLLVDELDVGAFADAVITASGFERARVRRGVERFRPEVFNAHLSTWVEGFL